MTPPDEAASAVPATTRPKTARIRADQWTALDDLGRRLQDARSIKAERITANTLIRVAIDGLLAHRGRLHGDSEEELLASWLEFLEERKAAQGR